MYAMRRGGLTVSSTVQRVLFSILKGTGHEVELLGAAFGILENLLERRARHHLLNNAAPEMEKISPADLEFLVTLLQVHYPVCRVLSWCLCRLSTA